MNNEKLSAVIRRVEALLAAQVLSPQVQEAVELLLNALEALCADKYELATEVERLRKRLEQKKHEKSSKHDDDQPKPDSNHSSEKQREQIADPDHPPRTGHDHRSFKPLEIHEERECPVDTTLLPPDALRCADDLLIVQDIHIEPHNLRFHQEVWYSPTTGQFYRGALPPGYDHGDFSDGLRALIIALKYCGNMSEPKIEELLANFEIQVSSGSISNILTNTASEFETDYHEILVAGLASTIYVQIDDTSARVNGKFWHTHIVCNPWYTYYSTQPRKDRLTVLAVLQALKNTGDLQFQCDAETLELLASEFQLPDTWRLKLTALGEVTMTSSQLKTLFDDWFGSGHKQLRAAMEQAAAIVFYRHQTAVPRPRVLVSDGAKQFEHLLEAWQQCWVHDGRHYEKLSPVVKSHAKALQEFRTRYWRYYAALQDYRAGPSPEKKHKLQTDYDELFATRTGYDFLDDRIAKTQAKRNELLTVLAHPAVPLHNNTSELGARVSARRRDVSLHSKSERGVRAMDIFTTLVQTAKKLGVSAYHYFRDRLQGLLQSTTLANLLLSANASG